MAEQSTPWSKGTINLLRGETDRLRGLARALDDLAEDLAAVDPAHWAGGAYDAFAAARTARARRIRSTAAAHEVAARALGDYVQVLADLADRRNYESESGALARLEQRRLEAAGQAGARLREAAEELRSAGVVVGEEVAAPVRPATTPGADPVRTFGAQPAPAAAPPEQPQPQPRPLVAALDPRAITDVAAFYRRVQDLSDAVHDHWTGH
ncbi:hypothetical protein M8542_42000 [Amycolatopsis sp. OK19-0408]|uniref:Putative T7SS secretion signal domain-containing protein n=1 Tax=Amycolatopsis iheyensis TaxID=2945988 RepID=A0A9X2NKW2_9PSEU|nr:hypothetical protein [Amycolatopsis iheyensis]MCR6489411.1 hypothetical protein [Amycolatopsis iheyensis]